MTNRRLLWRKLYIQVLAAIVIGIAVGAIWPSTGAAKRIESAHAQHRIHFSSRA
jgi:hypothetical protein